MAEGVYEAALEAAKAEATRPPASKKPSNPSAAGLMTLGRTGGGKGKAPGNGRKPANNPYEMLFE